MGKKGDDGVLTQNHSIKGGDGPKNIRHHCLNKYKACRKL